jgi:glycerate dehydrogenase
VRTVAEQRAHHWERCAIDTLDGKTLGIIGLGHVGRTVARLATPFGMRVIGVRRSGADSGVSEVFRPEQLAEVLERGDYLVRSVPHTPQTVGLLARASLRG